MGHFRSEKGHLFHFQKCGGGGHVTLVLNAFVSPGVNSRGGLVPSPRAYARNSPRQIAFLYCYIFPFSNLNTLPTRSSLITMLLRLWFVRVKSVARACENCYSRVFTGCGSCSWCMALEFFTTFKDSFLYRF
jgi:hypothetical protein